MSRLFSIISISMLLLIGISSCEDTTPTSCESAKIKVTNNTERTIYYTFDNGLNQNFLEAGESVVYPYGYSFSAESRQNFKYKYDYDSSKWDYSANISIDDCMNYYSVD